MANREATDQGCAHPAIPNKKTVAANNRMLMAYPSEATNTMHTYNTASKENRCIWQIILSKATSRHAV